MYQNRLLNVLFCERHHISALILQMYALPHFLFQPLSQGQYKRHHHFDPELYSDRLLSDLFLPLPPHLHDFPGEGQVSCFSLPQYGLFLFQGIQQQAHISQVLSYLQDLLYMVHAQLSRLFHAHVHIPIPHLC